MSGLYGSHDTKPADPAAEYDNVQHGKLEGSKRPSNGRDQITTIMNRQRNLKLRQLNPTG